MDVKTFQNYFLIILGPVLSISFSMKEGKTYWSFYLVILIFCIITIIIARIVYSLRKIKEGSIIRSAIYSIVIYCIITFAYVFLFDRSSMGWLLIVIPVMIVYDAPMALLVSFGTIRILDDIRQQKEIKEKHNEADPQ